MFVNVLLVVKWCWGLYPGVSSIVFHQKVGRVHCEYAGKWKTYSKTQSKIHCKSLRKPLLRFIYLLPSYPSQDSIPPICCAGVEWFGTSQVRLFRGNDAVNGVELEDGEVLPADCVVVGAGVLPNTRFVEGLSLEPWKLLQASASGGMKHHWEPWEKKHLPQQKTSWNTKQKNKTNKLYQE